MLKACWEAIAADVFATFATRLYVINRQRLITYGWLSAETATVSPCVLDGLAPTALCFPTA